MLTIHSWQGAHEHSEMEFIRTAGENELAGARLQWAEQTLAALVRDVPTARSRVARTIWHPGLARDYLLARYNAVTFRIEITTAGGPGVFPAIGRGLLARAAEVDDWSPALD